MDEKREVSSSFEPAQKFKSVAQCQWWSALESCA